MNLFHILVRTGNVISMVEGTLEQVLENVDELNANDNDGSTEVHASYATLAGCEQEFDRLTA